MVDTECLFCRIASREIPAEILHSTEHVVAFRDANPQAPTHVLVIPKEHIPSIADVEEGHGPLIVEMLQAAQHLARAESLDEGWRLVANVGPAAGQTVFHLHFHLLGGRQMSWPPG